MIKIVAEMQQELDHLLQLHHTHALPHLLHQHGYQTGQYHLRASGHLHWQPHASSDTSESTTPLAGQP